MAIETKTRTISSDSLPSQLKHANTNSTQPKRLSIDEEEDDNNNNHHHNHDNSASSSQLDHDQRSQQYQNQYQIFKHHHASGAMSTPASPKAKSAPTTPCNITPTAFHQNTSHLNSLTNPSPANTLPPDIRKNISATCRVLPSSVGSRDNVQTMATTTQHQTMHHHQAKTVLALAQTQLAQQITTTTIQQQQQSTPATSTNLATLISQTAAPLQPIKVNQAAPTNPANGGSNNSNSATSPSTTTTATSTATTLNNSPVVSLKQLLDELINRGECELKAKDYHEAVRSFTQCDELVNNLPDDQAIGYLEESFKFYSQRAEAHLNLANYEKAIKDSIAARDLNPKWTQAYYLQGQAQFLLNRFADSLAALSFGLAQDPGNKRLFDVLVESALNSNFKQDFEPQFQKLRALDYDKKPFVVVSVLGQELLAKGHCEHAAIILESALKLGPDNKKFKGSVLSTIALAYWMLKDYEKAISYMQKELELESALEDANGQCRVLSNLGYIYFKLRKFCKSLEAHRRQLNLAMKNKLFPQASNALNALGHVHSARNDYLNALTSHTRCLDILKQLGNNYRNQFNELISIGYVHSMLGDFKASEEKYNQAIALHHANGKMNPEEFQTGLIMVKFNIAYLALKKQSYQKAAECYNEIMELAQKIEHPGDDLYKMRAANGMGQAYRLSKEFGEARRWFEMQLKLAQKLEDDVGISQALCNLGLTWQHFKDLDKAWALFQDNMLLVEERKDPLLRAYAYSYIGSMYYLNGRFNEAQAQYEKSSNLFKDLDYCSSESKTIDLNMALVHQQMGRLDLEAGPPHTLATATASATTTTTNNNANNNNNNKSTTGGNNQTGQRKVLLASS